MAGLTVKYFMWPYQPHFQSSAQNSAKRLFDELLPGAEPRLLLVGVLLEDREDRLAVCIEPDHDNIQPGCFADLDTRAKQTIERDERSRMCYSHPVAAARVHERMNDDAVGRAIKECCGAAPGEEDSVFFVSSSAVIDSHAVFAVLRLRRRAFETQFRFSEGEVDRVEVDQSFVEAVIAEFLSCVQEALHEPNAGVNLCVVKASSEELLRRGGARFIKSVSWRVFGLDGLESVHGLCDSITSISAMRYEGDQAIGRFLLRRGDSTDVRACVRFRTTVSLRESRRIRKLLELAREDFALLLADKGVVGLTRLNHDARRKKPQFEIEVSGHHHWRILHRGGVLCEFRYGTPRLPRPKIALADFAELCNRILPEGAQIDELWKLVQACIEQRHGTTLVISSRAESEAARLSQQSTLIEPSIVAPNMVRSISSIDGALLVDQAGMCHAFGVILDGLATQRGDPGRGARFNSAIRYLESQGNECIACVVSEDGDVTLLPRLQPRVKREHIAAAIELLRKTSKENPLRPRVYAEALNEVDRYKFYLSEEQCVDVNEIVEGVEQMLDKEGRQVKVVREPMRPNSAMNDSFFFPHE